MKKMIRFLLMVLVWMAVTANVLVVGAAVIATGLWFISKAERGEPLTLFEIAFLCGLPALFIAMLVMKKVDKLVFLF